MDEREFVVERLRKLKDLSEKVYYAERTADRVRRKVRELGTDAVRARELGLDRIARELEELGRYVETIILPKIEKMYGELKRRRDRLVAEIRGVIDRCIDVRIDEKITGFRPVFRSDVTGREPLPYDSVVVCRTRNGDFVVMEGSFLKLAGLYDRLDYAGSKKVLKEFLSRYGKGVQL